MFFNGVKLLLINVLVTLNIPYSVQCPDSISKAAYKSGEILDQETPITLTQIKTKLTESGIFDPDAAFTDREKKELAKLFEAVEIMTTSRARQPLNSQNNIFSALRLVERIMKKQLKEGQISETLAAKFDWEKLVHRPRRQTKEYFIDTQTNMRVFNGIY